VVAAVALGLAAVAASTNMLYLVGLGLGDAKDITVKGLEAVRRCGRVYLEAYTSALTVGKEALVGLAAAVSLYVRLSRTESEEGAGAGRPVTLGGVTVQPNLSRQEKLMVCVLGKSMYETFTYCIL